MRLGSAPVPPLSPLLLFLSVFLCVLSDELLVFLTNATVINKINIVLHYIFKMRNDKPISRL